MKSVPAANDPASRPGKPATIKDVAARARVSTATVSRYLNGYRVRQARDIHEAIESLSFSPNQLARSLKSGSSRTIGVLVPDISNPFFADVVKGVESVMRADEYSLLLCNTDENVERERAIVRTLLRKQVDAILMAPATEWSDAPLLLRERGVPLVLIDRQIDAAAFDVVLVDNVNGAAQAAEYLVSLGHERIALIAGPLDTTPGRERHDGFVQGLRSAGRDLDEHYLQVSDFREDGGYQAALRLLAVRPAPTALFASNNLMSIGALRAIHNLGIRIPQEMSFVGFDDLALAELTSPPLTVITRPSTEQGVLAMRLLRSRMEETADVSPRRIVLETRLAVRGSCAPPPPEQGATDRSPAEIAGSDGPLAAASTGLRPAVMVD
ncbi:MAG: LacI family DNA-binding transcriptional regulator [Chloroflexi bacterium]|nr:LacI family DNA-binding transcriptional regulator [Chloroflexota bacterium]